MGFNLTTVNQIPRPLGQPLPEPVALTVSRSSVVAAVTVAIILSNTINIAVLKRLREIQVATRFLLINLSAADLIIGPVVCLPGLVSSVCRQWKFGVVYCQISSIVHGTASSVSIWTLATIGVERYVAVVHPIKYRTAKKFRYCALTIAALWTIGLVTFILPVLVNRGYYYPYQPAAVMCTMYWESPVYCLITGIYTPVLSASIITFTSVRISRALMDTEKMRVERSSAQGNAAKQTGRSRDEKAIRVLVITTIVYFAAWGPYTIVVFLLVSGAIDEIPPALLFVISWLANSNSFVNVAIYSASYEGFRHDVKSIFRFLCKRGHRQVEPEGRDSSFDQQLRLHVRH